MPFIALALVLAVALGGGASVAAQNALPGDPLWEFKVGVNEQVEAALAAEGKAQADFDIKSIEARMKEAAELSAQARLNAETRATLEENFEAHAKSIETQVANLEAKGDYAAAADIAARFQAALSSNASALSETGIATEVSAKTSAEARTATRSALDTLLVKVRGTLDTASSLSAETSAKAAEASSASADASGSAGASATVQTGTSVQGGQGGIQIDAESGAGVAI